MQPSSEVYADIADIYISVLAKDSPEAAPYIARVLQVYGGRIGLRAALIMTLFKIEVQQHGWIPGVNVYAHLVADSTGAIPLINDAMQCCLKTWGIGEIDVTGCWKP